MIDKQMHGNFELARLTRPPPLTGRFLRPQSGGLGDPEQQRRSRHQSTSARRRRTYPRRHRHRPKKRRRKRRSRSRHHRSRGSSHRGQRRCHPSRAASASAESGPAGSSAAAQSTAAAPPSQRTCGHAMDAKQREGRSRPGPVVNEINHGLSAMDPGMDRSRARAKPTQLQNSARCPQRRSRNPAPARPGGGSGSPPHVGDSLQ